MFPAVNRTAIVSALWTLNLWISFKVSDENEFRQSIFIFAFQNSARGTWWKRFECRKFRGCRSVDGRLKEKVLRPSFQVWDACSESVISFDQANVNDENSLAYIVENDVIQSCLLERLKQLNVEPRLAAKVKEFQTDNNAIRVELQNQKIPLRTRLLVSAEPSLYHPTNSVGNFRSLRTGIYRAFGTWRKSPRCNGITTKWELSLHFNSLIT